MTAADMLEITFIVALVATLALAASELGLRAFYRWRGAAWALEPNSIQVQEIDREALPTLAPIARLLVNGDGERGGPLPRDWSSTYRVLVVGGSAAECFFLDQDAQWPAVVERALNEDPRALGVERVHVGNIARSMVRCEYVDWMLGKTLPRIPRLDAVIMMVGASDLVAWLQDGCPQFVRPSDLDPDRCYQQHDFGPFGWAPSQLALRECARRVKNRFRPSVISRKRVGKALAKHRLMRAAATHVNETPDPAPMLAFYEEWLRRSISTARAAGARVLVARQPWLHGPFTPEESRQLWNFGRGRPYEEHVSVYFATETVDALMGALDEVSARVAAELGVEACDLRARVSPDFDNYYDELHFTPRGAELVGRAIAEALRHPVAARPASDVTRRAA